jgi:RNA polymerase sigma factor (TIGR02999 family)
MMPVERTRMAEEQPIGLNGDLVERADAGDRAAKDALFSALYDELHRLAHAHLQRSANNLTLSTTTLLHEAYVDIAKRRALVFPNRGRFLSYASRAMRGLIVEYVRDRKALKRGGELSFAPLMDSDVARVETAVGLERLDEALGELAAVDPGLAELVDLKFFCGFSFGEIAALRGVSERTVQRDWAKARLVLHEQLVDED